MKLLAFTIYDEKAECYGHPFFVSAMGIATRMLSELVKNDNSMVGRHPEDFTLYHIGFWRDDEAKFENFATPKFVARATDSILDTGEVQPQLTEVKNDTKN